jgi:8-oxo-dGTP diphosphatase
MKKQMVVGFAFTQPEDERRWVALIQKQRPEWQKGCLNGIGGKVEEDEHPRDAMEREFWEETGIIIPSRRWVSFAVMGGEDWTVYCYTCAAEKSLVDEDWILKSKTDEKVGWYDLRIIPLFRSIKNLSWLIPMALDALETRIESKIVYPPDWKPV